MQTQSPQIDPASASKSEKLRLTLKLAKDPIIKEKEDTARVKRLWQQMARRDIPKQHRAFTAALKKQTAEAKRVAELCQREVRFWASSQTSAFRFLDREQWNTVHDSIWRWFLKGILFKHLQNACLRASS